MPILPSALLSSLLNTTSSSSSSCSTSSSAASAPSTISSQQPAVASLASPLPQQSHLTTCVTATSYVSTVDTFLRDWFHSNQKVSAQQLFHVNLTTLIAQNKDDIGVITPLLFNAAYTSASSQAQQAQQASLTPSSVATAGPVLLFLPKQLEAGMAIPTHAHAHAHGHGHGQTADHPFVSFFVPGVEMDAQRLEMVQIKWYTDSNDLLRILCGAHLTTAKSTPPRFLGICLLLPEKQGGNIPQQDDLSTLALLMGRLLELLQVWKAQAEELGINNTECLVATGGPVARLYPVTRFSQLTYVVDSVKSQISSSSSSSSAVKAGRQYMLQVNPLVCLGNQSLASFDSHAKLTTMAKERPGYSHLLSELEQSAQNDIFAAPVSIPIIFQVESSRWVVI